MSETSAACDATWRMQGNPHLKGETSAFMVDQPDMSHMSKDWAKQESPALISVTYFTLKQGHEANETFTSALKKFAAAARWPYYYRVLQLVRSGDGAPDYVLVSPNKNSAEYGAEADPPFWKMVEGVYGKADTDALRKSLNDATEKVSEHVDSYSADLSYIPGH